jgi:hypothetical protein
MLRQVLLTGLLLGVLSAAGCGMAAPIQPSGDCGAVAREFGAAVYRSEHFAMVHADQAFAEGACQLLEHTRSEFYRQFTEAGFELRPTQGPLEWVTFGDAEEFDRYTSRYEGMDTSWLTAYYSARTNRVAVIRKPPALAAKASAPVSPEGGVLLAVAPGECARLSHEATHQLAFNSGLMSRDSAYPLWLAEGLACNFECDSGGAMGPWRVNPARAERLGGICRSGRMIPLETLVTITSMRGYSNDRAKDLYCQGWGLLRFLFTTRPAELNAYMRSMASNAPARNDARGHLRRFEDAFGPVGVLQAQWTAYAAGM